MTPRGARTHNAYDFKERVQRWLWGGGGVPCVTRLKRNETYDGHCNGSGHGQFSSSSGLFEKCKRKLSSGKLKDAVATAWAQRHGYSYPFTRWLVDWTSRTKPLPVHVTTVDHGVVLITDTPYRATTSDNSFLFLDPFSPSIVFLVKSASLTFSAHRSPRQVCYGRIARNDGLS